jgi:hypothetical protein
VSSKPAAGHMVWSKNFAELDENYEDVYATMSATLGIAWSNFLTHELPPMREAITKARKQLEDKAS